MTYVVSHVLFFCNYYDLSQEKDWRSHSDECKEASPQLQHMLTEQNKYYQQQGLLEETRNQQLEQEKLNLKQYLQSLFKSAYRDVKSDPTKVIEIKSAPLPTVPAAPVAPPVPIPDEPKLAAPAPTPAPAPAEVQPVQPEQPVQPVPPTNAYPAAPVQSQQVVGQQQPLDAGNLKRQRDASLLGVLEQPDNLKKTKSNEFVQQQPELGLNLNLHPIQLQTPAPQNLPYVPGMPIGAPLNTQNWTLEQLNGYVGGYQQQLQ